jgi:hypothetical protein
MVWWYAATLFHYFYINGTYIQYLFILYVKSAEPTFELGPALQQADALLSEPRRTLLQWGLPLFFSL